MCYLINVSALDFDGNLPENFRAYKLVASPTRNPTVLHTLGGVPYDITDGHCSCSLYVAPGADDQVEAKINAARKRYEKAGWSQGKIERALKAKSRSYSRNVSTTIRMALDRPDFQSSSFPEDAVVVLGRGNSDPVE
jgi:hypothetical protein